MGFHSDDREITSDDSERDPTYARSSSEFSSDSDSVNIIKRKTTNDLGVIRRKKYIKRSKVVPTKVVRGFDRSLFQFLHDIKENDKKSPNFRSITSTSGKVSTVDSRRSSSTSGYFSSPAHNPSYYNCYVKLNRIKLYDSSIVSAKILKGTVASEFERNIAAPLLLDDFKASSFRTYNCNHITDITGDVSMTEALRKDNNASVNITTEQNSPNYNCYVKLHKLKPLTMFLSSSAVADLTTSNSDAESCNSDVPSLTNSSSSRENSVCSIPEYLGNKNIVNNERCSSVDLSKLLELYDEETAVKEEKIQSVKKLKIIIHWEVPKAHKRYDDRTPTEDDHISYPRKIPLFTEKEDKILLSNWKKFVYLHNIDDPQLFFLANPYQNLKQKRKFAQFIGRGLPYRRLRNIMMRFQRLFNSGRRGIYTFKEDQLILWVLLQPESTFKGLKLKNNNECNQILRRVLKRDRIIVAQRIRRVKEASASHVGRIQWSNELCCNIIKLLLKVCRVNSIELLLAEDINQDQWKYVSEHVRVDCFQHRLEAFWLFSLSVRLSCKQPIYRNKLREQLIEWLYERLAILDSTDDVNWEELCDFVDVPSKFFVFQKLMKMICTYVPKKLSLDLRESVLHLHKHFLPILKSGKLKEFCLKRLKYVAGQLIEID